MKPVIKCNTCGKVLPIAKVHRNTPWNTDDECIYVRVEPCPVCLEKKYKQGKSMATRRPKKGASDD